MKKENKWREKVFDSYDNECFAPQFWEEDLCLSTTTQTLTEAE